MGRLPKGQRTKAQHADATEKLTTFRQRALSFYDASAVLRQRIDENHRFNRGGLDQWDPGDVSRLREDRRPVQTFNVCAPNVNFLAGYESEKHQDYRYFPRGAEDEQMSRVMTAHAKYAMDVGQGEAQLHRFFRRGIIGGLSTMHLCLNYDYTDDLVEGDLDFEVLPENSWAWDVFARRYDKQDAQWQENWFFMPLEKVRQRWPQHTQRLDESWINNWLEQTDNQTGVPAQTKIVYFSQKTNEARIARHYYREPVEIVLLWNHTTNDSQRFDTGAAAESALQRIRDEAGAEAAAAYRMIPTPNETVLMHQNGQMQTHPTPDLAAEALDRLTRLAGLAATRAMTIITRPTTMLRVAHYCGWELLDDAPSPYGRVDEHGAVVEVDWRYPYVPFMPYQDTDDFASIKGVLDDIKDPQRELNWDHATMLDEIVRGPKGGWWIPKDMHVDLPHIKKQLPRAGFVLEYAGQMPTYAPPIPLAHTLIPKMQVEMEAIMRISGINAELAGQTTQKTVSGRSIQARQSGGLVGVNSLFVNWMASKRLVGELLVRRIQQYYSVSKMHSILGQRQAMAQQTGQMGPRPVPLSDDAMLAQLQQVKALDFDVVVDFQETSPTARQATVTLLMQFMAAGMPIPPALLLEASDVPFKEEIKAALAAQGNQLGPPNEALGKIIGAAQGSGGSTQPEGVNIS